MTRLRNLAWVAPLPLEGAAAACIALGAPTVGLSLHLAAAGVAGLASYLWVDGSGRRSAALAATLLVSALPIVGAAIVAFVFWPSWMRRQPLARQGMIEIALPEAVADAEERDPAQSAFQRPIRELLREGVSPHDRVRGVMALRHMNARRAVPLLRRAFSHSNEDVRLLAFSILDRREKRLRARIRAGESRLAMLAGDARSARAEGAATRRRLARDHWELVYGGYVSGNLEGPVLAAAARHASTALEHESDPKTVILLARIHLREGRPAEAWACLEGAERAGTAHATCAPLFAEAAYMMRRFSEIPSLLGRAQPMQLRRPGLAPVAQFWTETRKP